MLILSRKKEERIRIGENITIVVTRIDSDGRKVSLGIEAPREMVILREELVSKNTSTI